MTTETKCLVNKVHAMPACGCNVVGDGTLEHPITIEFCAAHSVSTEQQFEQTRQELKTRLDGAIKSKAWATAEHWLAQLRKLDDVECMLMAFAPAPIGG